MTDDKLNLVLAAAMIRELMVDSLLYDPAVVNPQRLALVEEAAGLTVGVDGNAAFALVGENLAVGDSAFVQIDKSLGVEDAEAKAVAQLYENLIQKGPPGPDYRLVCQACEWSAGGRIVQSFVESVTVPKAHGCGYVRIPCIVCPVCHGDTVALTWGDPFAKHEAKP